MRGLRLSNSKVKKRIQKSCVVLHIQTSGDNPWCNCILQIGAVRFLDSNEADTFLVDLIPYSTPQYDEIEEVIPNEYLSSSAQRVKMKDAFDRLEEFVGEDLVILYNADHILRFFYNSRPDKIFLPLYVEADLVLKKVYGSNSSQFDLYKNTGVDFYKPRSALNIAREIGVAFLTATDYF